MPMSTDSVLVSGEGISDPLFVHPASVHRALQVIFIIPFCLTLARLKCKYKGVPECRV